MTFLVAYFGWIPCQFASLGGNFGDFQRSLRCPWLVPHHHVDAGCVCALGVAQGDVVAALVSLLGLLTVKDDLVWCGLHIKAAV